MILLIDAGNTTITSAFYSEGEISNVLRLKTVIQGREAEEYSCIFNGYMQKHHLEKPAGAALCSVVPEVTTPLIQAVHDSFDIVPLHVSHEINTGLKFRIKNAVELGADRIANAVAAHKLYKGNVIVADFGTATTFCVISDKGEYAGGAIMPGIGLAARSLAENTAQLPRIDLEAPAGALGKNTEENIRTGIIIGHAGAAEKIIDEIKIETGMDYTVLATGGYAHLVKEHIKAIDYINPLLTLEGLRFIYEMNN